MILSDGCSKKNKKKPHKLEGTKHKARWTDDWCDSHRVQTVHQLWLCRFLVLVEDGTMWMEIISRRWAMEMMDGFSLTVCLVINGCVLLLQLSHTLPCWFSFTHRPVRWFISTRTLKCGNLEEWQNVQTGRVLEPYSPRSSFLPPFSRSASFSPPVTLRTKKPEQYAQLHFVLHLVPWLC